MAKKNNSKKQDGRGRSAGSRRTQFSASNQPDQSRRQRARKPEKPYNAADPLREAFFEDVTVKKNGKSVKAPYIEAFLEALRKVLSD